MNLNKDAESWAKVSPSAVSQASTANIFNVIAMAIEDIQKQATEIVRLRAERDRIGRNRDMWKDQCARQATLLHEETK